MKRRILSLLLVLTMGMSLLVGCGGSDTADDGAAQGNEGVVKQEEFDKSIYSESVELTTAEGKTVQIYYDPTIIDYLDFEDSWFTLGSMHGFSIQDAETAQGYIDSILAREPYMEIGEQEEIQLGDHTIHCFRLNDKESGGFIDRVGVIELGSEVIFEFSSFEKLSTGGENEEMLGAMRFVVE